MSNNLRQYRETNLISKAELARRAGISTMTIDRIEAGFGCRVTTKRRILEALGVAIEEREVIFPAAAEAASGEGDGAQGS